MSEYSFALNERQATPAGDIAGDNQLQAGVVGDIPNPDLSVTPVRSGAPQLLGSLAKVVGRALEPALKRSEEAAFLEGMSRAAAGEAAKDIAAETPAWANFFGEGAGVLGARAYEGQADASSIELESAQALEQDRALPPQEYARALHQRLQRRLTGDPIRDSQMQASALKLMPALMKAHAKLHVQFNQEQATRASSRAIGAAFNGYEAALQAAGGVLNDDDLNWWRDQLLDSVQPIPGQDPEAHGRLLAQKLQEQLSLGNFNVMNWAREVQFDGSRIVDHLPDAVRDTLNREYEVQGARHIAARVSSDLLEQVVALRMDPTLSTEELDRRIEGFNMAARVQTGIEVDLISGRDREALYNNLIAQRAAGNRQQAAAVADAQKEALERGLAERAWTSGSPGMMEALRDQGMFSAATAAQVGQVLWTGAASRPDAIAFRAQLLNSSSVNLPAATDSFTRAVAQAEWSPLADVSADIFARMTDQARGAHIKDNRTRFVLARYNEARAANPQIDRKEAWASAQFSWLTTRLPQERLGAEDSKALEKAAKAVTPGWFRDGRVEQGMQLITALAAAAYRDNVAAADPEARAAQAIGSVRGKIGLVSNVAYYKDDPFLPDLATVLVPRGGAGPGVSVKERDEAFRIAFERVSQLNPGEYKLSGMFAMADASGELNFVVQVPTPGPEGFPVVRTILLTQRQIQAALDGIYTQRVRTREARTSPVTMNVMEPNSSFGIMP